MNEANIRIIKAQLAAAKTSTRQAAADGVGRDVTDALSSLNLAIETLAREAGIDFD